MGAPSGTALMAGRRQAAFCSQERLVRSLSMEEPMVEGKEGASDRAAAFVCSRSSLILISLVRVTNYPRNAFSGRRSMLFNDNDNNDDVDVDPLTFRFSAQMPPPPSHATNGRNEHAPFIFVAVTVAAARARLPSAREDLLRPRPPWSLSRSVGTSER